MKKIMSVCAMIVAIVMLATVFTACGAKGDEDRIVIYSTSEDFANENALKMLNEKFPEYDIILEYYSTGNCAAKLLAEGMDTECDIIMELESGYLEQLGENLAKLDDVDMSVYKEDLVSESGRYIPWTISSGSVIVNKAKLEEKGLEVPESYEELTDPKYEGLISMPNPASSGTGYFYLLNLVNVMGEDEAFAYFDRLAPNILQFTSSGSGPVNALITGEADIALGMTFQAVNAINEGNDFEIHYFEEGSPYTAYGSAIIEGKQDDAGVKEVFDYIAKEVSPEDKRLFHPENIFAEELEISVPNYPQNIPYADMTGIEDSELKERLLDRWAY